MGRMDSHDSHNSTTLPLRQWISNNAATTANEYQLSAVNIGLLLTQFLLQIASDNASSLEDTVEKCNFSSPALIQMSDVIAENVIVHLSSGAMSEISGVDIQKQLNGRSLGLELEQAEPFDQKKSCYALGKILLEVFSRGQSSTILSSDDSFSGQENNYSTFGDMHIGELHRNNIDLDLDNMDDELNLNIDGELTFRNLSVGDLQLGNLIDGDLDLGDIGDEDNNT